MISMFSGKSNLSTHSPGNMAIWFSMAFQAGTINIGGYLACHRFVTHTTGFATLFGAEIAQGEIQAAIGMVSVPLFFLVGNMTSAFFIDRRINQGLRPQYPAVMAMMSLFMLLTLSLGVLKFFGDFGSEASITKDYLLLSLLCLTSGVQNGTITSVSGSVVRTTHLTGLTTDLGIGLVRVFSKSFKLPKSDEIRANWMRLGILASFILGSWFGAVIFLRTHYWGFSVPLLISSTLWYLSCRSQNRDQKFSLRNVS